MHARVIYIKNIGLCAKDLIEVRLLATFKTEFTWFLGGKDKADSKVCKDALIALDNEITFGTFLA